jgi:predicted PurR-regulated permease PerM
VLKKYKFGLVLVIAVLLNIFVFFWFIPNTQKNTEQFDIETTLKKIEQNLVELNEKVDKQNQILENLQMQKAINDLLLTIE